MASLQDRPNTALVVIDVQNGVVADAHDRDRVVANIGALVDTARAEEVPVIWVQHYSDELVEGTRRLAVRGRARTPRLRTARAEAVRRLVRGHHPRIRTRERLDVGRVIVAGAQTDACIRATLHGAFVRGYDTTAGGRRAHDRRLLRVRHAAGRQGDRPHQHVLDVAGSSRANRRRGRHGRHRLPRLRPTANRPPRHPFRRECYTPSSR